MKIYENPYLNDQEYQEVALPSILTKTAELTENDKSRLAKYWSLRPATVLTQILRTIQSLISYRTTLLEEDALINDDLIVENAVKVIRIIFYASLLGGDREKKLLAAEVVDTTPCSLASSTASSVTTIPDEGISRTRRSDSFMAVGNQIYEIIRGNRQGDDRIIAAVKDPMNNWTKEMSIYVKMLPGCVLY